MVTYRFFTLGESGEMLSHCLADHATDAQARWAASLRLKAATRVEIWRGAICIWQMSADRLALALPPPPRPERFSRARPAHRAR